MPMFRRRPLSRAAAVGGVAYLGAKAGARGAMNAQAAEQAPAEPPPPAAPPAAPPSPPAAAVTAGGGDVIEQIQKLATLRESGALSDEEFAAAKAQVLG